MNTTATTTTTNTIVENGICEMCKKEWGTGAYCKTVHNHITEDEKGDDLVVCCDCWCKKNDYPCHDAWEYTEREEEED